MNDRLVIERTFSQRDFDQFALLSGDDNPIHVDPAFSARTRFGRTVAHGVLLCTIVRGLIERLAPGAVLRRFSVMYPAPTFANELMQFGVWRAESQHGLSRLDFAVQRQADSQVTCSGQAWIAPDRQ